MKYVSTENHLFLAKSRYLANNSSNIHWKHTNIFSSSWRRYHVLPMFFIFLQIFFQDRCYSLLLYGLVFFQKKTQLVQFNCIHNGNCYIFCDYMVKITLYYLKWEKISTSYEFIYSKGNELTFVTFISFYFNYL